MTRLAALCGIWLACALAASAPATAGFVAGEFGLAAPPSVRLVRHTCSACLARCATAARICANSSLSEISCRHADHACRAACSRDACTPHDPPPRPVLPKLPR